MSYDWDGKRAKRMNIIQSIAFGPVIVLACGFVALLSDGLEAVLGRISGSFPRGHLMNRSTPC